MIFYPFITVISTGGAAKKAIIQTEIVVNNVGIIKHLNHLTYSRFFVAISQASIRSQNKPPRRTSYVEYIRYNSQNNLKT